MRFAARSVSPKIDRVSLLLWLMLAATLPLMGIRSSVSTLPVVGAPVSVAILALAVFNLLAYKEGVGTKLRFNSYCAALYIAAFLFLFVSLYSDNALAGIDSSIKLLVGIMLFSYINSSAADVHCFMKVWGLSSAAIMLAYMLNSYFVLDSPYMVNGLDVRAKTGKNQLAFYLAIFLCVTWIYRMYFLDRQGALTWIAVLGVHFIAIIYVMSRSAWVTSAILLSMALFFRVFFQKKYKDLLLAGVAIAGVVGVGVYIGFSEDLLTRFETLVSMEDEEGAGSIQSRKAMLTYAMQEFSNNAVWGIGVGGFIEKYSKASHNTYLQYISEMGVWGVLAIFLIHLTPLFYFSRRLRKHPEAFLLFSGVFSLLVYGMAINMQNSPMWLAAMALFYRFYSEKKV